MGLIMKNGIQYPGNASSGGEGSYTLPIASAETLGGIKVGENLSITEDGTLNVTGGGDGSSVSWNQIQTSGNKIAEVTIDGTKTDVYTPTGGSSGGGSYTETVLYDYREDNGGVICYDTTTQTLRDDIENYDLLWLEITSSAGDLSGSDWKATCQLSINVNLLSNGYNPNYMIYTSYDTRSSRYYIKGKEFKTTIRNAGNTNGLVRMLGIKF